MVKVTRLITNDIIIGKTTEQEQDIVITDPYSLQMGAEGMSISPLDYAIVGKTIPEITIKNINVMYSVEPIQEMSNSYLKALSGIEEPNQEIIT